MAVVSFIGYSVLPVSFLEVLYSAVIRTLCVADQHAVCMPVCYHLALLSAECTDSFPLQDVHHGEAVSRILSTSLLIRIFYFAVQVFKRASSHDEQPDNLQAD